MSDSVRPHRRQPPGSPVPGILQARTLEWVYKWSPSSLNLILLIYSVIPTLFSENIQDFVSPFILPYPPTKSTKTDLDSSLHRSWAPYFTSKSISSLVKWGPRHSPDMYIDGVTEPVSAGSAGLSPYHSLNQLHRLFPIPNSTVAIIYLLDTFKTPNPIFLDPSRSNLLVYVPQKMATIKHKHPLQISYYTNTKDYNLTDALCSGGENGHPLQYLAWKIPWTEEPGRLQSTGSQSQTWTCMYVLNKCILFLRSKNPYKKVMYFWRSSCIQHLSSIMNFQLPNPTQLHFVFSFPTFKMQWFSIS